MSLDQGSRNVRAAERWHILDRQRSAAIVMAPGFAHTITKGLVGAPLGQVTCEQLARSRAGYLAVGNRH